MFHYAIGCPGEAVRIIVSTTDPERANLQCMNGEVAIPVEEPLAGTISPDGLSVTVSGIDMLAELDRIRARRQSLLDRCDWRMMPDAPTDDREAWADYRQALRDITESQPDTTFADIVWPTPPTA